MQTMPQSFHTIRHYAVSVHAIFWPTTKEVSWSALIKQTVKLQFDLVNDKSEVFNVRNKVEVIDIYHQ